MHHTLFWCLVVKVKFAQCVWLFVTPWTIQSMEFSRPEYWSGQPFRSPGDLPQPRDWTQVSCIAGRFFTSWVTREARMWKCESEIAQSCQTLCDPMGCSLPGSSVHGIFQERILAWFAISFSRGSSRPRDWTWVSHNVVRLFTFWANREALLMSYMCLNKVEI